MRPRLALLLLTLALLCGACSVKYAVVGTFEDYNEVLMGEVRHDLTRGEALVRMTGNRTGRICAGKSRVDSIPLLSKVAISFLIPYCKGQSGSAVLSCDDGRKVDVVWTADTCTRGTGHGRDQSNNRFAFAYGMGQSEALAALSSRSAEAASRPDLPAYSPWEPHRRTAAGQGTGFFVSDRGHVVTHALAVQGAGGPRIRLAGRELPARILAMDNATGLVLLQADTASTPLPVALDTGARLAEEVFTLGYPSRGLKKQAAEKAAFGRVTALAGVGGDTAFLQTDLALQSGNWGGPLLDSRGNVIGVIAAVRESEGETGHAVKADRLAALLRDVQGLAPLGTQPRPLADIVADCQDSVIPVSGRAVALPVAGAADNAP